MFAVPLLLAGISAAFPRADVSLVGSEPSGDRFAVGGSIQRLADDLALGAQLTTPSFLQGVRVTGGTSLAFFAHGISGGQEVWLPYSYNRAVLEVGTFVGGRDVRIYLLGGPELMVLPKRISEHVFAVGGVGGLGLELNFLNPERTASAFVEFGGMGSPARASSQPGAPILGSGFFLNAGILFYL